MYRCQRKHRKNYPIPYKNSDMKLGERLRKARKAAKLTQAELSRKVGISQPTLSDIENGNIAATTVVVELARATGVSSSWLAEERGEMYEPTQSSAVVYGDAAPGDGGEVGSAADSSASASGRHHHLMMRVDVNESVIVREILYKHAPREKLAKLFEALTEAYEGAAVSQATFELMMTALHAELAAVPSRDMAPIRQILHSIIDLRNATAHGMNEPVPAAVSESELDRKARAAAAGAIPGDTESGNARFASGGAKRQRR